MVLEDSVCEYTDLEDILIEKEKEPRCLRLSLLESITNNFSTEIGRGGFAIVYKGLLKKGKVAVKKLDPKFDMDEKNFRQEVKSLMSVKHENIVRFLGYCYETQGKMLNLNGKNELVEERMRFLCFEYLPQSLDKYITDPLETREWKTCYQIIKGICEGLLYLHQENIMHLDLKPANILLDHRMVPKIADFGLSKHFDAKQTHLTMTSDPCGSMGYMAPELLFGGKITPRSDIYSLGMIILELLTGRRGHPETDDDVLIIARWKTSEGDPLLEHICECIDIGVKCIEHIAAKRPKVEDIIEMLSKMEPKSEVTVGPTKLPLSLLESITNNFSDDHQIGSVGFAVAYKGVLPINGTVVVKKLKSKISEMRFQQQVDILTSMKHKNIVRFLGYCFDTGEKAMEINGTNAIAEEQQGLLCFEYLPHSLDKYIRDASVGLGWMTCYQIIKGICKGLHYLHQHNNIHMNLRPANILLDHHMRPKIDFDLSRWCDEDQTRDMYTKIQSMGYTSPEYNSEVITLKSDIYSLGIMIIEILTGSKWYPFMDQVLASWRLKFEKSPGDTQLEAVQICTEIGIACTDFNPSKRPDTQNILERLDEMESTYGIVEANLSIVKANLSTSSETNAISSASKFVGDMQPSSAMQQITNAPTGSKEMSNEICYLGPSAISKQLEVYPLEIRFCFEPQKKMESPVTLSNRTDRYIGIWISQVRQQRRSYYYNRFPVSWGGKSLEDPISVFETLKPHSTKTVDMVVEERLNLPIQSTGMFEVLMMVMRSEEDLVNAVRDLKLHIARKVSLDSRFIERVEESGGEVHQAMLKAVIFDPESASCKEVRLIDNYKFIPAPSGLGDVKGIDVHPSETWILTVHAWWICIWNYQTQKREKLHQVTTNESGVHDGKLCQLYSAKFIARGQWFAAGDGDGYVHVYDYAAMNKVKEFQAHDGTRIDSLAVYPTTSSFVLTASSVPFSSDNCIKLWDWSQDWTCIRKFDNQSGTVTGLTWNLWDTNTFASSSCGGVKIWDIHSSDATTTWPHSNAVFGFDTDSHRNVAVTSACRNDNYASIWDMQTKECVHKIFVSNTKTWDIACHPTLPIWVTTSGRTVGLWDARTYRIEKMFQLTDTPLRGGMVFINSSKDLSRLVVGCEKGIAIVEINLPALKTSVETSGDCEEKRRSTQSRT